MPCNSNFVCNDATASGNHLNVNGSWAITFADTPSLTGAARATNVANRLVAIFSDWARQPSRDLDFITPSYVSGAYAVICPRVLYPGGPTYLSNPNCGFTCPPDSYPARETLSPCPSSPTYRCLPENLYDQSVSVDNVLLDQSFITEITVQDTTLQGMPAWQCAFVFANQIRQFLAVGTSNVLGNQVSTLVAPTTSTPAGTIIYTGGATYYGAPSQGTTPADASNICCATTANGEFFHPCDLTIALSNSLYNSYRNQWVQVCYGTSPCLAARVTDSSGVNGLPDLSFGGVARVVGFPGSGSVTIKTMD